MRKSEKEEKVKQGMAPAAKALSDDDLMDVSGGGIYKVSRDYKGRSRTVYVVCSSGRAKCTLSNEADAKELARRLLVPDTVYASEHAYWADMGRRSLV